MQARWSADELDDVQLVVDAQAGDAVATVRLIQRHEQLLRHVIRRTLDGGLDVEDVLQETALQIWQHIGTLRDAESVRAWMARIARNSAIRAAMQHRPQDELHQETVLLEGPDADVERFDLHRDLAAALSLLPLLQAQAWRLRELDGRSYREIAAELGVSEPTVRGSLVAARRRVHETTSRSCPGVRQPATSTHGSAPALVPSPGVVIA